MVCLGTESKIRTRIQRKVLPALVLLGLLVPLLMSGCGSARAGRFEAFAQAGRAYSKARNDFLDQSLDVAIQRDTQVLRQQREVTEAPADRVRLLTEFDGGMQQRIEVLQDLKDHSVVLNRYFDSLADLSTSDAGASAESAANALAGQMGGMTTALAQKQIFGRPISSLLGQATGLAVAGFRNRALQRHLQAHAATIERELLLEESLLKLMADEMESDLKSLQQAERRQKLVEPFRASTSLPSSWDKTRKEFLQAQLDLAKVRAAGQAAAQMRQAYNALTTGSGGGLSVAGFEAAVQRLSEAVSSLKPTVMP